MSQLASAWKDAPAVNTTPTDNESERWRLLLESTDSYSLAVDALRYGPLTPSGLLDALDVPRLSYSNAWPKDPVNLAALLKVVGADAITAPKVLHAYQRLAHVPGWQARNTLQTYHVFLSLDGKVPAINDLLRIVEHTRWTEKYDRIEPKALTNAFSVMWQYLKTPDNADVFLKQWLPSLPLLKSSNNDPLSISCELAKCFNAVGAESIADFCIQNRDLQGLAFLTAQGRYPLYQWLLAVAEDAVFKKTTADIDDQGSQRLGQKVLVDVFQEMLSKAAHNGLTYSLLVRQCQYFAATFPHAIEPLLSAGNADAQKASSLEWVATLCALGALPSEHPSVLTWLTDANNSVTERTAALLSKNNNTVNGWVNRDWYAKWSELVSDVSPAWNNFLARRFCIDVGTDKIEAIVSECGDLKWLNTANVLDIVQARQHHNKTNTLKLYTQLLPFLSQAHYPHMGAYITQQCAKGSATGRPIRSLWKSYNPKQFGKPIPERFSYSDASLILYALTRQDPQPLLNLLKELGVGKGSETYGTTASTWIQSALGLDTAEPTLPAVDFTMLHD